MLDHPHFTTPSGPFPLSDNGIPNKRKRRPAGTPDPDAEVVSLSPKTLLESDQYVCEICNQGFQRDQNLQMHRRRHKVTWKLLKRDSTEIKKKVFVCPEPSCLHHDPCHALGDLVGIKKHYRRKHSNNKQWVCEKCSKGYAVQSDYKAHLKTCGTRGHSCDCGRVFSRVESFIEHQDACTVRRIQGDPPPFQTVCSSRTASSTTPSGMDFSSTSDMNFSSIPIMSRLPHLQPPPQSLFSQAHLDIQNNLELQLLPSLSLSEQSNNHHNQNQLNLSIGQSQHSLQNEEMRMAMTDKAFAEDARMQAKKQIEIAEREFENAKRIRQQAKLELERAKILREQANKKIDFTILEITCYSCRQRLEGSSHNASTAIADYASTAPSYMSSALIQGEGNY